jgi:hypothetical protein
MSGGTITRDEFLEHIRYVRDDIAQRGVNVERQIAGVQTSVEQLATKTQSNALEIALLKQAQTAAQHGQARRRRSTEALFVAVVGAAAAGAFEWVKSKVGIR